jgi:2TM domain
MLILVLVPINLIVTPETPWFIWPMVGWGSVLAIHTAWAMGLFDILSSKD